MATPSNEYWAERALQREQEAYLRGSALSERLFKEYERAARDLKRSISAFYGKYAAKHGLTYEQAMARLTRREAQEWLAELGDYVDQINAQTDPKVKAALTAQLDALSANSQISRLEALLADTQAQLDLLYDRLRSEMETEFGSIYTEGYYHKHYDLQARAGWLNEVAKLTPGMIQDAVSYPWSGANFSDRLWKNKEALLFNLRETVTQSLIQGRGLPATSQELAAKMGQSYKVAERLVRTETNHLHNRADLDAYEAAGVEEYEFMATLDSRTSEICATLDGKRFKLKDAVPGENLPPMHPNCRSTTVEYDPEEAADWAASGEKMPERMTYAEWYQKQVAEHGEGYVELERKKAYRESIDRAQWERYSDLLGKDAPKKFKAFQDMKYGDADIYPLYKLDYSRRSRLLGEPELGLPGAEQAKAEDDKFLKYLFNPENQRGYAKGLAFKSRLGYDETNWKQLQKEILNRAVLYPARQVGDKGFGMKYEQKMILYGTTGKPTNVVVSWIDDSGSPRMTSAYIKEVKEHEN